MKTLMKNIRRSIYVNIILALFILTLTAITNLAATTNPTEGPPQLTVNWVEIKCNSFSQKILEPSKDAQIYIPPVHGDTVITVSISGNKGDELVVLTSLTSPIILLDPEYRRKAGFDYLTHLTHQSEKLCFYRTSDIEFTITGKSPESTSWTLLLLMTSDQGRPYYPLLSIAASEPIIATMPTNVFELTPESLSKSLVKWEDKYFVFPESEKVTVEIEVAHLLAKKPDVDSISLEIDNHMEVPYIEWMLEDGNLKRIDSYTKIFKITPDNVLKRIAVSGVTPKEGAIKKLNFIVLSLYDDEELVGEPYVYQIYTAPESIMEFNFTMEQNDRIEQLKGSISALEDDNSALQNNKTNLQNEVVSLQNRKTLFLILFIIFCTFFVVGGGVCGILYRRSKIIKKKKGEGELIH